MSERVDLSALDALDEAATHLRDHQQQMDIDGIIVGVSRQAVDEVLAALPRLLSIAEAAKGAVEALGAVGSAYINAHPMRTADFHAGDCACFRCAIDDAATAHAALTDVLGGK